MVDRVVAAGYRIRTRLDGTTEAFALSAQDLALALGSKVSDLSCAVALSARTDDYSCVNDSCSRVSLVEGVLTSKPPNPENRCAIAIEPMLGWFPKASAPAIV